ERYSDCHTSSHYACRYAERYATRYAERYADRYATRYAERYADRYDNRYPNCGHQEQASNIGILQQIERIQYCLSSKSECIGNKKHRNGKSEHQHKALPSRCGFKFSCQSGRLEKSIEYIAKYIDPGNTFLLFVKHYSC